MTALTAKEVIALDNLPKTVPAIAADQTDAVPVALGTRLQEALTGVTPSVVTLLKTAATATAVANATDLTTALTLVNDLKAKFNALANGIDALP